MSEEIAKCAWRCPNEITVDSIGLVMHPCSVAGTVSFATFQQWNAHQARILAARRKDYQTGWDDSYEGGSFDDYIKEGA